MKPINRNIELLDRIINCLKKNIEKKYTTREIAEWIRENHSDYFKDRLQGYIKHPEKNTRIKTPTELVTQISAEVSSNISKYVKRYQGDAKIKTLAGKPKQFYYTDKTDEEETDSREISDNQNQEQPSKDSKLTEKELYPLLKKYLSEGLDIDAYRIDETKSSNTKGRGGNKWLFPDIVGIQDLDKHWGENIKKCAMNQFDTKVKLWSFEVKIQINSANVRESFFQAVSNCSWANFGYLVANELKENALPELTMLSALHGIGFILLDIDNPIESQILLPTLEKLTIDWNTVDRITKENTDFKKYIKEINTGYALKRG